MGYDRGDSFPFNLLNKMEFHLVRNQFKCERKLIHSFLSEGDNNELEKLHPLSERLASIVIMGNN